MENQNSLSRREEIKSRLDIIKNEINKTSPETTLVAVTKYSPVEDLVHAYQCEHFDFGENKVQDLADKALYLKDNNLDKVRWHMIGHLQSNKVKELLSIPNLVAIHSIDSIKLCEELVKREALLKNKIEIFLQFNTSNEEEKSGFLNKEDLVLAIDILNNSKMLKFSGLMTMGTIRTDDPIAEANRCFAELIELKKEIEAKKSISGLKLSMGMSSDYKVALKYQSSFIRLGSTIFKLPH